MSFPSIYIYIYRVILEPTCPDLTKMTVLRKAGEEVPDPYPSTRMLRRYFSFRPLCLLSSDTARLD
jgi:hypothetical protein